MADGLTTGDDPECIRRADNGSSALVGLCQAGKIQSIVWNLILLRFLFLWRSLLRGYGDWRELIDYPKETIYGVWSMENHTAFAVPASLLKLEISCR